MSVVVLRPRPPYDLRLSAAGPAGGTRRWVGGALELAFRVGGRPASARVRQRPDGALEARVGAPDHDAGVARLRALLAVDDDHSEFLRLASADPLLAGLLPRIAGLRPARLGSVAHALVAAMCGQLVRWRDARRLERAVLSLCAAGHDGLRLAPTTAELGAIAPAQAAAVGLAARRATAMVRVARQGDLERLAAHPTERVVARLCRERALGPWSAAMVCIYGLGRHEAPLTGDLGLMRLLAAVHGRWPDPAETAELVAPYGDWAGLAGVYLQHHPAARAPLPRRVAGVTGYVDSPRRAPDERRPAHVRDAPRHAG